VGYVTLLLKNERNPRTYKRDEIKFFTPKTFAEEEPNEGVLYINSEMVAWMREANNEEIRERMHKGRSW